jgi:NAD(P)-dependent dehydrogenase (short-subunit alcohol dehydrogenase family)
MSYNKPLIQSKYFPQFKDSLPSQIGKVVVITGTTSGTGQIAAHTMAELGATVILLNRPSERSRQSFQDITSKFANAAIQSVDCDLQSFDSVRQAAKKVRKLCAEGIDILCNNAGIMAFDDIATEDGYDIQMQTNHLSHFLLTAELMPCLQIAAESRGESRIVNHSSIARLGAKKLEAKYLQKNGGDLGGNNGGMLAKEGRWQRYSQTKLANAAFTAALHHKLTVKESRIKALVAHPGLANTGLQVTSVKEGGMGALSTKLMMKMAQSQEDGAMGILSCMCLPEAQSGQFYGPGKGRLAGKGKALPFALEKQYDTPETRDLLWSTSCKAIGMDFLI